MTVKSILLVLASLSLAAQKPSTITVNGGTVSIHNETFQVAGQNPRLVLRLTENTKQVTDEKGMEAVAMIEAWPLGSDRKAKPLYTVRAEGVDPRVFNFDTLMISRGLEDVEWWSLYRVADGKPLFDTYVPPVRLFGDIRYAGYDVPADGDPRLKDPKLVGVVILATESAVMKRVEIRCSKPDRARLLRSYADVRFELASVAGKNALSLQIVGASPDVKLTVPLSGGGPIQACDIVAR